MSTKKTDDEDLGLTYEQALHAMQTGVGFEIETNAYGNMGASTPKHLRAGVNSAMINDAALVRLLVKKGLFTEEEYMEEVRLEANREVLRYERNHVPLKFR